MTRIATIVGVLMMLACQPTSPEAPVSQSAQLHEIERLRKDNADLVRKAELQKAYIAETAATLAQIQESLAQIALQQATIRHVSEDAERRGSLSEAQRDSMLVDLTALTQKLDEQSKRIAEFREKDAASTEKIEGLTTLLNQFEKTVAERNAEIATLRDTIRSMSLRVTELERQQRVDQSEIEQRNRTIQERDRQVEQLRTTIRTGFYVAAPVATLVRNGIVREQSRIFRRRTRSLALDFDTSPFTAVVIDETREIIIEWPHARIEIISPHPVTAYDLVARGERSTALIIKNPDAFWRFRYLVVAQK